MKTDITKPLTIECPTLEVHLDEESLILIIHHGLDERLLWDLTRGVKVERNRGTITVKLF